MSTYRADVLEQRVQVMYWVQNNDLELFEGTVKEVNLKLVTGKLRSLHFVVFDDGDQDWLDLDHYETAGHLKWPETESQASLLSQEDLVVSSTTSAVVPLQVTVSDREGSSEDDDYSTNNAEQKRSHGEPPAKKYEKTKDLNEVYILNPTKRSLQKDLVVSSTTSAVLVPAQKVTVSDHEGSGDDDEYSTNNTEEKRSHSESAATKYEKTKELNEASILNPTRRSLQTDIVVSSTTSAVIPLQVTVSDHAGSSKDDDYSTNNTEEKRYNSEPPVTKYEKTKDLNVVYIPNPTKRPSLQKVDLVVSSTTSAVLVSALQVTVSDHEVSSEDGQYSTYDTEQKRSHSDPPAREHEKTKDSKEVYILNSTKRSLQKDMMISSTTSAVVPLQATVSDHEGSSEDDEYFTNNNEQKRSHSEPPAKKHKKTKDMNAVSVLDPTKRSSILPRLVPRYSSTRNNPKNHLVSLSTEGLLVSDEYDSVNEEPSTSTNQNGMHSASNEETSLLDDSYTRCVLLEDNYKSRTKAVQKLQCVTPGVKSATKPMEASLLPKSIDAIIRFMDRIEPGNNYFKRQQDSRAGCSGTRGKLRKFARRNPSHPAVVHWVEREKWEPPDPKSLMALMELIKKMIR
jgi:hypothetical protein